MNCMWVCLLVVKLNCETCVSLLCDSNHLQLREKKKNAGNSGGRNAWKLKSKKTFVVALAKCIFWAEVAFKQLASAEWNYRVTCSPRWRTWAASGHLDFGLCAEYTLFWLSPGLWTALHLPLLPPSALSHGGETRGVVPLLTSTAKIPEVPRDDITDDLWVVALTQFPKRRKTYWDKIHLWAVRVLIHNGFQWNIWRGSLGIWNAKKIRS